VKEARIKFYNGERHNSYPSLNSIGVMKPRRMSCVSSVVYLDRAVEYTCTKREMRMQYLTKN
jgi:hypothetical protein